MQVILDADKAPSSMSVSTLRSHLAVRLPLELRDAVLDNHKWMTKWKTLVKVRCSDRLTCMSSCAMPFVCAKLIVAIVLV